MCGGEEEEREFWGRASGEEAVGGEEFTRGGEGGQDRRGDLSVPRVVNVTVTVE